MKFSADTERLLTKEHRQEIPLLLERFKLNFSQGRLYEGVKYAIHIEFRGDCTQNVYEEIGSKAYFTGKVMGKDVTIFFFIPLFA